MKKTINGFTIIELVVVITIIGIISTIGLAAFSSIQSGARDSNRSSNIKIISEALEKYYTKNGEYPSCTTMQSNTLAAAAFPGIDVNVFTAPGDTSGHNSFVCNTDPTTSQFAYFYGGSSFTLKYKEQATSNVITLASRHGIAKNLYIEAIGGGGGGGGGSNAGIYGSVGGTGTQSSFTDSATGLTYTAYGGLGGTASSLTHGNDCYGIAGVNGANGTVTVNDLGGSSGTGATGGTGGLSAYDTYCHAGNGGIGGDLAGSVHASASQIIAVNITIGGAGGNCASGGTCGYSYGTAGTSGAAGAVTIKIPSGSMNVTVTGSPTITYLDSNGLNSRSSPAYSNGYTLYNFATSGSLTVNSFN